MSFNYEKLELAIKELNRLFQGKCALDGDIVALSIELIEFQEKHASAIEKLYLRQNQFNFGDRKTMKQITQVKMEEFTYVFKLKSPFVYYPEYGIARIVDRGWGGGKINYWVVFNLDPHGTICHFFEEELQDPVEAGVWTQEQYDDAMKS